MDQWPKDTGKCGCQGKNKLSILGDLCVAVAQHHAVHTNCLNCGRVACVLDKGTCPFCGGDPEATPDVAAMVQRLSDAPKFWQDAERLACTKAQGLVEADSQCAVQNIVTESGEETTDPFSHPTYAPWETIQEAKERFRRQKEHGKRKNGDAVGGEKLATLLGFDLTRIDH